MPKLINNVLVRLVRVIRVSDVVSLVLGDFPARLRNNVQRTINKKHEHANISAQGVFELGSEAVGSTT